MKKIVFVGTMMLIATIVVIAGRGTAEVASAYPEQSLPASLDDLYPPKAQGPMYLIAMRELNMPLSGLVCDLFENDIANVQANFERFKSQYARVSQLVPEWESTYPDAPVNELGAALKSGDRNKVMGALDGIDAVCHGCHVKYMAAAQHRYHWGDFASISVDDPVMNESMDFKQFKLMINTDMMAISNDLEQGQIENARKHAEGLSVRYETMTDICENCHDTKPKYYVSGEVQGMLEAVRAELDNVPVNQERIGELVRGIGTESCFKCHLVHIPAAYSAK